MKISEMGRSRADAPDRRGFTLVELLVTVVVLGILASISMRVIGVKEKAYIATMKSDLRSLTVAQIAYFDYNLKYAPATAILDFNKSPGVNIIWLGGPRGYTARAIHKMVGSQWCAIFFGDPSPAPIHRPATIEGVIACGPKGGGGGGGGGKKKK